MTRQSKCNVLREIWPKRSTEAKLGARESKAAVYENKGK